MSGTETRYDRQIRFFGTEGQQKLQKTKVALVGVGGVGSAIAQHLALLGVGHVYVIEPEELDESNRNRFIGARDKDPVPGSRKAMLAARLIAEINPQVGVTKISDGLVSSKAFDAVKSAHWVFGCFDHDGPRFILNELSSAYTKPYIDVATDVPAPGEYGGRVCISLGGQGCLYCLGEIDSDAVHRYLSSQSERDAIDAIYGVNREALDDKGPSVSPINGVVASLAATEFMVAVTGQRAPARFINYRAHLSVATKRQDTPKPDCPYCKGIRGIREAAEVERYLRIPHLVNERSRSNLTEGQVV
ncbi:HesA/MoeB/ThiF family protein [Lentisalinibacter salinarum]|uniref:HesA/MoeB/ThiF family protein n=1 Tax=Lentisalinibacter salinarum TaxID=2992239 RepID=UPI00386BED71